jgi:hypothetical protein
MATSFWTQFNPNIKQRETVKRYFNRYLYKIVIDAPGARSILDDSASIEYSISKQMHELKRLLRFNEPYWERKIQQLNTADVDQLTRLRTLRQGNPNLKFRVEEPRIQIYADTEQELTTLVGYLKPYRQTVTEIYAPKDNTVDLLNGDAIIRRRSNGYRYRVNFRDTTIDPDIKANLLTYLDNLTSAEVLVPKNVHRMLTRPGKYIWSMYMYSNDLALNSFIELICPGIIAKNHELVVRPTK